MAQPIVLFTAFEPSGDAHAAPIIAELRQTQPGIGVYAWGGAKMEEAGAIVVEQTADGAAMGVDSWRRALAVKRAVGAISRWSETRRVVVHVPVDSPAANFPICRALRKQGTRTVHLIAPQLWAWAPWRIKKLRRLTDLVLCVLPFEEQYFNERRVPARFIGHPGVNRTVDNDQLKELMHGLPQGAPRLAIFPGSRVHEVKKNLRMLVAAFIELQGRHQGMSGLIVAASPAIAQVVRKKIKVFPTGLNMVVGQTDTAIYWADLALAVSGTITLQIARHATPMIGVYKTGPLSWLGAKLLVRTPFKLLPNIIAEREIVPEFVPHLGGAGPIVTVASQLLNDSRHTAMQTEELKRVILRYANKQPARESVNYIVKILKDGKIEEVRAQ